MANVTLSSDLDAFVQSANDAAAEAELLGTPDYVLANKNTTAQTGIVTSTFTEVTWPTEVADTAGKFAANRLTPGNGEVWQINTNVAPAGVGGARVIISIGKNGSELQRLFDGGIPSAPTVLGGSIVVVGNGTDYFNVLLWQNTGSDQSIYAADGVNNYFSAFRIR